MNVPLFVLQSALLFFNGAFAIALELIWCKRLEQLLGVGLFAVTQTVSYFMLGLALGGWIGAKICNSSFSQRKLKSIFVSLQAGTVVACLLFSAFLFSRFPYLIIGAAGSFIFQTSVALLIIPALGTGVLLPLAIACFAASSVEQSKPGSTASVLYSCNLFGSLAGAALTVFWFMPAAGLWHSALIAITLALFALCLAIRIPSSAVTLPRSTATSTTIQAAPPIDIKYAILLVAGSGFMGIALELIYVRVSSLLFGAGIYALALVLICYLLSSAAGAWTAARFLANSRINTLILIFGPLIAAAYTYTQLYFLDRFAWYYLLIYKAAHGGFAAHILACMLLLLVLEFVPIFALGAFFVAVLKRARNVGYLICSNNLGSIAGAWTTGFLLIPNLSCALPGWNTALLSLNVPQLCRSSNSLDKFSSFDELNRLAHQNQLDFYCQGLNSTVSVFSKDQNNVRYLKIDGLNEGSIPINWHRPSSVPVDLSTHLLLAELPLAAAPARPLNVCLIGYGTGTTCSAILSSPRVRQLQIVELEKCVIEAAKLFKHPPPAAGTAPLLAAAAPGKPPAVTLHLEDARSYLLRSCAVNDVIISQPFEPWVGGASTLFTKQYWQICRRRLAADGVLCQWVQLYGISPQLLADLCRSFISVFPNTAVIHAPGAGEIFLLAGNRPLSPGTGIDRLFLQHRVRQLQQPALMLTPAQLRQWCSEVAQSTNDARIVTDDNLLIEYAMPHIEEDPEACISANLASLNRRLSSRAGIK